MTFVFRTFAFLRHYFFLVFLLISGNALAISVTSASFNPATVNYGGSSTLSWATDGMYCIVDGQQYNGKTGSKVYANLTVTTQVVVTCHAPMVNPATRGATVVVLTPIPGVPASVSISPATSTAVASTAHCIDPNAPSCIPQYVGSVTASWSTASGTVTRYEAQRQLNSGTWANFYSGTATSSLSTSMSVGSWSFRVRACNDTGCSTYKSGNGVTVQHPIPTTPASMSVSPATTTATSVTAIWGAASGYITRYEAQRQSGTGNWETFYSSTATSATSGSMSVGSWSFRVRACNNTGCSAYRSGNGVTIQAPIPGVPTSMTITPTTTTTSSVTASWGAATGAITRYEAQRQLDAGSWENFYSGTSLSATSSAMSYGSWAFRIRACNNTGCSAYRSGNTVTITLPKPTLNVAESSTAAGNIGFSWSNLNTGLDSNSIVELVNGTERTVVTGSKINAASPTGSVGFIESTNGTHRYVLVQYKKIIDAQTQTPRFIEVVRSNEITVAVNIALPGLQGATALLPASSSETLPYTATTNNMGDAEIRVPVLVVPGVNQSQPKLALVYNSNRLRKLIAEGWEEDNLGTGWRVDGMSAIRKCSKQLPDAGMEGPYNIGDFARNQLCLDGELFLENNPISMDTNPNSTTFGQLLTPWKVNDAEYVLWNDSGIKIRHYNMTAPGWGGYFKVYYPDGSVSEYGSTADSRLDIDYISYTDANGNKARISSENYIQYGAGGYLPDQVRVQTFVWRIRKRTDAFGNEIVYEYYEDETRDFALPKRIVYGPKNQPDTSVEFNLQERVPSSVVRQSSPMVPPLNSNGVPVSNQEYLDWLSSSLVASAPTAINKVVVKHNNNLVREYNLVHEDLTNVVSQFDPETNSMTLGAAGLVRLKHIQLCAYKNSTRDCLKPLSFGWNTATTSQYLGRINRIEDNHGNWVDLIYRKVVAGDAAVVFTDSPFGVAPTAYPQYTQKPNALNEIWPENYEPSALTEMRFNDGQGGYRTFRYRYQGIGVESQKGWGFMGYYGVRAEHVERGTYTYSQYSMDHRFFGRKTAEQTMRGLYGSSGSKILSKSVHLWDSFPIHHNNYRWVGNASLILQAPVRSNYGYLKQSVKFNYEAGQLLGAIVSEETPRFDSLSYSRWKNAIGTNGTPEIIQESVYTYPQRSSRSVQRWVSSAVVNPVGTNADNWGKYQLASLGAVIRSKSVDIDYQENRNALALQVAFPTESRTSIYDGDVISVPVQTTIQRNTAYPINGIVRDLVETSTQFAGDTNLELITRFAYNTYGVQTSTTVSGVNVPSRTSSSGDFVENRYPQTSTNALNQSATQSFDTNTGLVVASSDLNGLITSTNYDAFGRPLTVTTPDQVTVTTGYALCELVGGCPMVNGVLAYSRVTISSPISPTVYQYLDSLGREIRKVTTAFDGVNQIYLDTHYDTFGQVVKKSLPYYSNQSPQYIQFGYDELGRLTRTTNPDASYKQIDYAVVSGQKVVTRTTYVVDSQGVAAGTKINKSYFNAIDEVVKTTDAADTADQISTEFQYYATGLTKNIKVGGVQVASFVYDAAGNRTILNDQNAGTVTSAYNGLGQLRYTIDNAGQRKDYTYDLLGRPSTETTTDGVQRWFYDPSNNIGGLNYTEFTDIRAGYYHKRTMGYYSNSKPSDINTEIRVPGFSTRTYNQHFTYDTYGRADTVSFPTGITVKSNYNSAGYLASVADTQGNSLQKITSVDVLGNVTQMSYGQGVTSARSYNPLTGALESVSTTAGSTSLQNNNFKWRSDGLMESRSTTIGQQKTERFNYDNLSRLTSSTTTAGSSSRTTSTSYALNGNILSKTASNSVGNIETQATGFQYGTTTNAGPNAVSAATVDGIYNSLYYNANGGITRYDASTGADRFVEWTARGNPWRLTKGTASNDANPDARDEIAYGVDGERYFKKSTWKNSSNVQQTEVTFYVGDYEDLQTANDPQFAQVERSRINDNVMHIRTKTHTGVIAKNIEFLHKDHLGSIEAITNISGQVLVQMSFDAFGSRRKTNWVGSLTKTETDSLLAQVGVGTSRGYTGHEHLDRTGFIHMNGRVYDPVLSRFLSPDPLVQAPYFSQSYNRYSYVWNNPLGMSDPSGYQAVVHSVGFGFSVYYDLTKKDVASQPTESASENTNASDTVQNSSTSEATQTESNEQMTGGVSRGDVPSLWDRINPFSEYSVREWARKTGIDKGANTPDFYTEDEKRLIMFLVSGAGASPGSITISRASAIKVPANGSSPAGFSSVEKLIEHFEKHGGEFQALSAKDYLNIGRDIMKLGVKFQYQYKGETRIGYAQFMGNSARGDAKFGFVGTNGAGNITTIHVKRSKEFWKLINGSKNDNTIRIMP